MRARVKLHGKKVIHIVEGSRFFFGRLLDESFNMLPLKIYRIA